MTRAGIVVATGLALVAAAPAQAKHGEHEHHARAATFSGTCAFHVNVRFDPPLGATPQQGTDRATGQGPCTGTFTDDHGRTHTFNGDTVRYVATDSGPSSCAEGAATGGGFLGFHGSRLRFALTEARAGAAATLNFAGRRSGAAAGDARVSPDSDPAGVVQSCLGSGLAAATVDIDFATTPAIAG